MDMTCGAFSLEIFLFNGIFSEPIQNMCAFSKNIYSLTSIAFFLQRIERVDRCKQLLVALDLDL